MGWTKGILNFEGLSFRSTTKAKNILKEYDVTKRELAEKLKIFYILYQYIPPCHSCVLQSMDAGDCLGSKHMLHHKYPEKYKLLSKNCLFRVLPKKHD
jgi:hypothetical protein